MVCERLRQGRHQQARRDQGGVEIESDNPTFESESKTETEDRIEAGRADRNQRATEIETGRQQFYTLPDSKVVTA